jgi:hypothetical protein
MTWERMSLRDLLQQASLGTFDAMPMYPAFESLNPRSRLWPVLVNKVVQRSKHVVKAV